MPAARRVAATVLTFCLLALAGSSAFAQRSIRVDLGDSNFDTNGEIWSGSNEVDFTTTPSVNGTLPFAVNFSGAAGAGQAYDYTFSAFATYPAGLDIGFGGFPGGNFGFILPYFIALPTPGSVNWTSGEWSIGKIDLEAPYVKSEAVDAIRFTWKGQLSSGDFVATQLVFLDRSKGNSPGDFDLEFNYGSGKFDYPAGGSQSLDLGPESQHFFSFGQIGWVGACYRDGVADICAPVPEPSTLSLLAGGIALLSAGALHRRVRQRRA